MRDKRSKIQIAINPKLRENHAELDRRAGDRRQPRTLWQRLVAYLNRRWENWRRWLRAAFDAAGMSMGVYSFFKSFGSKALLAMMALGFFLAPISDG